MARAFVVSERQPDTTWKPTVAFLATPTRLDAKALPGDARRSAWLAAILAGAQKGAGTWEQWVDEGVNGIANGHDLWAVEVEPELTLEALYQREVLGMTPTPMSPPSLTPSTEVPELGGYRKVKPQ
jgi:hypothetical protein